MTVARVARGHYRQRVSLARRAMTAIARLWSRINQDNIADSWTSLIPASWATLTQAQSVSAGMADGYVEQVLAARHRPYRAVGRVRVDSLVGVASDGRPLDSLLFQPAIASLTAISRGASPPQALAVGRVELDMIVRTQVADAGRVADQVAIVAEPSVDGYVRMLVPPSCSRCVLLAGVWYEWNAGFNRHPRCDCVGVPAAEDDEDDIRTDPEAFFQSLSEAEQNRIFTKSGAQAIRDGADIGQVVNARRGMSKSASGRLTRTEAGLFVTGEGATRRGYAGKRLGAPSGGRAERLMPESIYEIADGDRDEAIRLLRLHGYLH